MSFKLIKRVLVFLTIFMSINQFLVNAQKSGDVSLPASSFAINKVMTVYYEFKPAGSITFAIKRNEANKFFGLGLGTSMTGSDIWVFEIKNNKVVVSDRFGNGHVAPPLDTSSKGKSSLQVLGYEITNSYTLVKFSRKLNTGDAKDTVIKAGATNFIYATADSPTLTYHGSNKGTLKVTLVNS